MNREELLAFLYKARSFFERAEELTIRHNNLVQKYKEEIPHEDPKGFLEYSPYFPLKDTRKEWKTWKGLSGFLKIFGLWCLRMISFILMNPDYYSNRGFWILAFIYSARDTIILGLIINVIIHNRNKKIKSANRNVVATNQAIQQENQLREQENKNIDNHNANLDQTNREIDQRNEEIREYNRDVDGEVENVNRQMYELAEEVQDFIMEDQFPKEDFNIYAIDFYINEVENHRCDSIKECANAYVEAKRNQETREFYDDVRMGIDEQIQIGRGQMEIGREQAEIRREHLKWQKISTSMQFGQILQGIANAHTVADAVNQNTAATNRAADASNRAADAAQDIYANLKNW